MGESLYGKFGTDMVIVGFILLVITFFVSIMFGFLLPESTINLFFVLSFLVLIVGIVLGIVGIIKDDLREKAIRALIAGICFLLVGIALIILYNIYISALFG
ncbi:MAG: hypothetical protein KGD58_18280 [Candidatus Lokiarchaeota archaeon]|nr:hypothetical protein [Candidatus Lokiarchaeota archaeon]